MILEGIPSIGEEQSLEFGFEMAVRQQCNSSEYRLEMTLFLPGQQ
jgi:hypothetical protein